MLYYLIFISTYINNRYYVSKITIIFLEFIKVEIQLFIEINFII